MISLVVGPTDPVPIEVSSILVTGMTPPAVEVTVLELVDVG